MVGAAASGVASFAIDAAGCVWSWGTSKRGQLGQGTGIAELPLPRRVHGLEGVASVACGWGHALALTGMQTPPQPSPDMAAYVMLVMDSQCWPSVESCDNLCMAAL